MKAQGRVHPSIGTALLFVVVLAFTMVRGAPSVSASPTQLELGVIQVGSIVVEYLPEFEQVSLDLVTETSLWMVTGGTEPGPWFDITFHVDSVDLDHITLLLVEVFIHDTGGCSLTFHGPLELESTDGMQYHGYFEEVDLESILFVGCDAFLIFLILSELDAHDVLVLFHLD